MRFVGGHDDRVAGFQVERLPGDGHLRFAVEDVNQRVEGRGMFAQALVFIEGKQRDVARFRFCDLAADYRAFLVGNHIVQG